jgi:hypothetical protein
MYAPKSAQANTILAGLTLGFVQSFGGQSSS